MTRGMQEFYSESQLEQTEDEVEKHLKSSHDSSSHECSRLFNSDSQRSASS